MTDSIDASQPNTNELAFVVGGLLHRVSIHTQQLRVLNLIADLEENNEAFRNANSIAIIGGGFAGITAAAALQCLGKPVRLFERKRKLLPLQYYSRTRFLQPTSVNWPHVPLKPESDLPFLNWHCDFADSVARQVHRNFEENFEKRPDNSLSISRSTEVTSVERAEDQSGAFKVNYATIDRRSRSTDDSHEHFDCVFFVSGFSPERTIPGNFIRSYWENSSIRPIKSSLSPPSIGVVGDGDGSIIEVMRCFWRDRSLSKLYRTVANTHIQKASIDKIIEFDKRIKRMQDGAPQSLLDELADEQHAIFSECLRSTNAVEFLTDEMEFDTSVHLYSTNKHPYSLKASPIHKAILAFLIDNNYVVHAQGRVMSVGYQSEPQTYFANLSGNETDPQTAPQHDRMIVRIGPQHGYDSLVTEFFGQDRLQEFEKISNNKFDFSNPYWDKGRRLRDFYAKKDEVLIEHRLGEAERTLQSYLVNTLGMKSIRVSVAVDADPTLTVFAGGAPSEMKRLIPEEWLGIPVVKSNTTPPSAKRHAQRMMTKTTRKDDQTGLHIHAPLYPREAKGAAPRYAVASLFLEACEGPYKGKYVLSARHAFPDRGAAPVRTMLDGKIVEVGHLADELIQAIIDGSRFGREIEDLRDVGLIRVHDEIECTNEVGDIVVDSIRSPMSYALEEDSPVFVGGKQIGDLVSVLYDVRLEVDDGREIEIEVFGVQPNRLTKTEMLALPSGSLALDNKNNVLGMLVGSTDDHVLFLDVSKIVKSLDMELISASPRPCAA